MSYKKYKFEVIASDQNSPFFRNYIWTSAFFKYGELFDIPRLVVGVMSEKNSLDYLGDMKSWAETHEALKAKALADDNFLNNLIDRTCKFGEEFNVWSVKNIFKANLKTKSNIALIKLLHEFADKQAVLYGYGVALPVLDFMNFSYVENNLNKILKSKIKASNYTECFSAFTYPVKESFAQEQEKDLLKLMIKFWSQKSLWQNLESTATRQAVSYLQANYSGFYQALLKHTEKHAWVYYAYNGPKHTEENFIDYIKDYLVRRIDPKEELDRVEAERKKYEVLKLKYLKMMKLTKFEESILLLAGKMVWGKPRRKDYQSKSYYHSEKLLTEIGRRLYLSLNQVRSTPFAMIEEALLKDKPIDVHYVNDLYRFHICLPNDDGTISILIGKVAENFAKNKVIREEIVIKNSGTLKGDIACPGKVKGVVKIINDIPDLVKMNYGDILVSYATNPNLVSAMKKAGAIISNEGGLTCHAAIVSRELGKPCIINTRVATKFFKDGDLVEVDANKGIIKKIK